MKRISLLLLLLTSGYARAQTLTISGKAIDAETKEPLIFASVGIKGKAIGTITNLQGEFDFHFPGSYQNETFVISMLGYKNYEIAVTEILNTNNQAIELSKSSIVLNEVIVSDSLRGGEILSIALTRIEENYSMEPYLLEGFYRDIKKIGGTYVSLLEAAVKIYDEDYRKPRNKFRLHERVALLEVRRSLGYTNKFTAYFDEGNMLEDLLLHNNVRYRQFPEENIFFNSILREKDSYYNGQEIYVVAYRGDYDLKIFIDKKTYGIIHIEYENVQQETINKKRGLLSKFVSLKKAIDFRFYQGKLYLNYINVDSKINWYDIKTEKLKFETELSQHLLINTVSPNSSERIGSTEKMRSYGLQYQDLPYNKKFWDNYNVIKESPLDRKIIEDLEKEGSLDKQFGDN